VLLHNRRAEDQDVKKSGEITGEKDAQGLASTRLVKQTAAFMRG
jgi:hypothetical protein